MAALIPHHSILASYFTSIQKPAFVHFTIHLYIQLRLEYTLTHIFCHAEIYQVTYHYFLSKCIHPVLVVQDACRSEYWFFIPIPMHSIWVQFTPAVTSVQYHERLARGITSLIFAIDTSYAYAPAKGWHNLPNWDNPFNSASFSWNSRSSELITGCPISTGFPFFPPLSIPNMQMGPCMRDQVGEISLNSLHTISHNK